MQFYTIQQGSTRNEWGTTFSVSQQQSVRTEPAYLDINNVRSFLDSFLDSSLYWLYTSHHINQFSCMWYVVASLSFHPCWKFKYLHERCPDRELSCWRCLLECLHRSKWKPSPHKTHPHLSVSCYMVSNIMLMHECEMVFTYVVQNTAPLVVWRCTCV
jgi:hypothetical protein